MKYTRTVVTACDHNYLWGAILLGLSLRRHNTAAYYHVLGFNLPEADIKILESMPDTKVYPVASAEKRSVCIQKPLAIKTAETDTIIWMDSDCIVTNNLDDYFAAPDGKFQIRFRKPAETAQVYRDLYLADDKPGTIPRRVLDIWKADINDLQSSKINTAAQTNCFVLTGEHLSFIDYWQAQMEKVIPADVSGVYDKNSIAYSMTDESTLNSLFAFSSQAPQVMEYTMDKNPDAYVAHFGLKPKPWQHWTTQSLHYYNYVQQLLQWGKAQGYKYPALPDAFLPANYLTEFFRANLVSRYKSLRYTLSSSARILLRKWRKV